MTTERRRRGRPAQATRRLIGGVSLATTLGLVAFWSATEPPTDSAPAVTTPAVHVVVTDPRIDRATAVAAAVDAAARGVTRVTVPVAPSTPAPDVGMSNGAHATTRAS